MGSVVEGRSVAAQVFVAQVVGQNQNDVVRLLGQQDRVGDPLD
jgi:hypothetical protein